MRTRQSQVIRKTRTISNKPNMTKKAPPPISNRKHKPFPFVCTVCGKTFRSQNTLTCHLKNHTEKKGTRALPKPNVQTVAKRIPVVALEKTLQCHVCKLKTPNADLFKRHVSSHKHKLKKEDDDDIVVLPLPDPLEITEEDLQSALKLQEEHEVITLDSDGNEEEEESWLKIVSVRGSNHEGIFEKPEAVKNKEKEKKPKKKKRRKFGSRRTNYKFTCDYCEGIFRNPGGFMSHTWKIHKPRRITPSTIS